ncbi:MAG: ABC transporter permease [Trueperaceae bacterium]|nr:ABC transporter permease [Trueperaceae bacterium]
MRPRQRSRSRYLAQAFAPLRLIFHDRLATTGVVILGTVIVMALAAPWVATHDPRAIVERAEGSWMTWDEDAWRVQPAIGLEPLYDLAVRGGEAIAVGADGLAKRFDGRAWTALPRITEATLRAVAAGDTGAIAVGDGGVVAWYVDDEPRALRLGDADLHGVTLVDDGRSALIVGAGEAVWHLPLAALEAGETDLEPRTTRLASPVGRGLLLRAVATDADGSAIAVGERGLALTWSPDAAPGGAGSLALLTLPSFRDFNGLHVDPDGGRALIVGERGTLLRREGPDARWVEDPPPDTRALRGAWIGNDGRAWAVGRNGVALSFDGEAWQRDVTGTERHFWAVAEVAGRPLAIGSDPFVDKLAPPSAVHWFGTDHLGRDLFSQNVYGSRIALLVGFLGAALVVLIGANVGLFAGYFRGRTDTILMRIVDVMYGIPFEPFAMILVLLFDPSLLIVILAISLLSWRTVARLIRSQVLSLSERPFVKAARVAGASDLRILYLHIAPNVLPLVFLELAIILGASIIAEATLSFLGLGPPQSISWGGILHNARLSGAWRTAWWWNIPPGAFIMITVLAVFFISRALEVIANPRLRGR